PLVTGVQTCALPISVRAQVVEVERGPEPEELRREPGRAALGLAHRAHAPRAVAHPEGAQGGERQARAAGGDRSLPEAELRQARRVHEEPVLDPRGEARLLERRAARAEEQVRLEPE